MIMHIAELFCIINKHNHKYILTSGILIENMIMKIPVGMVGALRVEAVQKTYVL